MRDRRRSDDEARVFCRAIRAGWDVPADRRPAVIGRLVEIATGAKSSPRDAVSAARALLQAARLQLEAVRVGEVVDYADVLERLEVLEGGELGPGPSVDGPSGAAAGDGPGPVG